MKIGEFFEKHVQWIALGLAGVWLLWVGWTYGINRPEVELGGQKYSAGSIDEHIRDTEMASLNIKLANQNIPPGLLDMPDFTDAFVNAMNGQTPAANKVLVINSPPPYQEVINVVDWNKPTKFVVSELPKVVVPTEVTVQTGMSLVAPAQNLPAILNVVANNNNNADSANAGNKTIFNDNAAQAQPAGVAGAAAVPGQPVGQMDKNWDTVFAKLNFTEQDKEFTKVGIPPFRMEKQYIEVQLQRQEVLPDGSFGKIDMVQGLPMNRPPVDRKNAADFIKWSADPEAQRIILAPPFYTIVKGTSWEIPHKDVPAVAQAQQPVEFNLQQKYQEWKTLKTMDEQKKFQAAMTPEQRQQFNTYRLAEEDKEKKAKAPPPNRQQQPPQRYVPPRGSGIGGGRGAAPGRGENFDAIDPSLLREMYADGDPPARRRPLPQEYDNAYLRMRSMRRPYQGDYSPLQPLEGQPQQSILGNLQPDALGNVDIWAHDETAQPGRTYRYRLRAVIKNPVYDTNIGSKPEMNQAPYLPADLTKGALDMTSAWSEWSKPVAIPTNVDMMLVSAQSLNGREVARFRVKRFQEGQINEAPKPFEVAPGDTIGGTEKVTGIAKPVDFTTTWMLVDIRQTGNDYRVRIMDPQGRMEVRTLIGDRGRFKDEPGAPKPGVGAVGLLPRQSQN